MSRTDSAEEVVSGAACAGVASGLASTSSNTTPRASLDSGCAPFVSPAKPSATASPATTLRKSVGGGETLELNSIYVGQVEYSTTEEQLLEFFKSCGRVVRVTILRTPVGRPKGFAYVEFANAEGAQQALQLNGSEFNGRALKVSLKRVNTPIVSTRGCGFRGGRGGYGRGGYGRGRGGGGGGGRW